MFNLKLYYDKIAQEMGSRLPGGNGSSAYELAVQEGFAGTLSEWLLSLKGETGATGPQGDQGNIGTQGANGVPGGMVINVQALTSSPADGATVYFGMLPKAPVTSAGTSKVYIRKACTLKVAEIYCYSGTAGTSENWSLYVRKNNSSDTLIATLGVATNERIFSNAGLNISFVAGDYFEIKGIQPTWATNPATCIYGGYLYFE